MSLGLPAEKFLVVQNGARHDYAIPAALHRAGALSAIYTDFVSSSLEGSILKALSGFGSASASAFARRVPPSELEPIISSWSALFVARAAARKLIPSGRVRNAAEIVLENARQAYLRSKKFGEATHLYSMLGEPGAFLNYAKREGLFVISDVYIALSADEIVAKECALYPDWADTDLTNIPRRDPAWVNRLMLDSSHLLVCPSEFVRNDLIENFGVDPASTVLAPYAVNPKWLDLETIPDRGRVLFAGSANVRKGIHYLAGAANALQGRCRVRIAGSVSDKVRDHPDAAELEFLGHLGQAEMAQEFARADVFVLPSLAEGSASVTAEALGAGVPVVTTKAAGSIVRDGIDGIVVPERDSGAIADAVWSIVSDRKRREVMSRAARHRAQQFGWDGFVETVRAAARQIEEGAPLCGASNPARSHRKAS